MESKKIILLVEDNPDDADLIQLAFERNNITEKVVRVGDGIEALDYLFSDAPAPQLVLLDLQLPRLSGLEVLQRIRSNEKTKLQPVVLFTSSREQEDLINGYRFGANSFIRKPIDFAQLVDAARHLVFYWMTLNELPGAPHTVSAK
jgi:two-component system, response regulator